MQRAFAIYRLPYGDYATLVQQTEGEPAELLSCTDLNGRTGFVVAPFDVKPGQPILLIRPDEVFRQEIQPSTLNPQLSTLRSTSGRSQGENSQPSTLHYAIDFANFHAQLLQGTFRKIVLARQADETTPVPINPIDLFHRACQLYPRMFIALVYTKRSGYWLTATPEILLEGSGRQWRTIALAGTMKLVGDQLNGEGETVAWSTKNIEEQRVVATYIAECLEQFTGNFQEEGPRTVRAADLVHLRSDFTFTLHANDRIGDLLHALHPTPAVCGLPKRDAFRFIVGNEHTPRRYYSGFMGPMNSTLNTQHSTPSTHLYVSLRCMNIEENRYHLYAGGGLLKESTEEQEWQETEAKLETMRRLLTT